LSVVADGIGAGREVFCQTGRDMTDQGSRDPLHGITLEMILTQLVERYGWDEMGRLIRIRCFNNDPSIKSSLQFLRKTPWARKKVEALYLKCRRKTTKQTRDEED
jgi:uncharacterized protein (DUF2132 family)